jgi:hypothetical protein
LNEKKLGVGDAYMKMIEIYNGAAYQVEYKDANFMQWWW